MISIQNKKLFFWGILFGLFLSATQAFAAEPLDTVTLSVKEQTDSKLLSKEYINTIQTKYILNEIKNKITPYMQQKLSLYNVFITNDDIYEIPKYKDKEKRVLGLINYLDNEIVAHACRDEDETKRIVLHELGHSIDTFDILDNYEYKLVGKYSETVEFNEIFKEECESLELYSNEYYFKKDVHEFFAESFAIYMRDPEKVKKRAPKLFKYMETITQLNPMNGWQLNKNNRWYYLENNEYKVGWFKDKDGKWYYFSITGEMMRDVCIDGYCIGPNGVMKS